MPSFSSHPVTGTLTNVSGTNVNEAYIWIYNKTKDEMHSGWDSGFTQLVTNSSGEYSGNLGSFTGGWDDADEIFTVLFKTKLSIFEIMLDEDEKFTVLFKSMS